MTNPLELRDQLSEQVLTHDYSQGPLLILAGPGTGKTHNLIETIRCKIDDGLAIDDLYQATLTNAAAEDFLSDVHEKVSDEFAASSTLHFRAKGLLHTHAQAAVLNPDFVVIDDNCEDLIHGDLAAQLKLNHIQFKSVLRTYRRNVAATIELDSGFARVYRRIQAFYSALDWFDVMRHACELLISDPEIREYEAERFEYLLIDEYQDLNPADQLFVELLVNGRSTLLAVGDDDQSIYSGRFADASGIIEFGDRYPTAKVIQLPVTSRIPSAIINASYQLISMNSDRAPKDKLIPLPDVDERADGGFVVSVNTKSGKAEAKFIYDAICRHLDEQVPPEEILVLCSCRALGQELLERVRELDQENRVTIRDLLTSDDPLLSRDYTLVQLLRLITNPDNNLAMRVVLEELAEGETTEIRSLVTRAMERQTSIWAVLADNDFLDTLPSIGSEMKDFRRELEELDPELSIREMAQYLAETLPSLAAIGEELTSEEEEGIGPMVATAESEQGVRFITLHSSKGLDADFVLIPFLEDDVGFPGADEEEHRRILYVALTRAKVGVAMSWAWSRRTESRFHCSGSGGPPKEREPSHLIAECGVPENLVLPWEDGSAPEQALELLGHFAGRIYSQ